MTAQQSRPKIEVTPDTLDLGQKSCRSTVKRALAEYRWITRNIPGEQQKALNALLGFVIQSTDYLDLESPNGLSLDVWCELRDDLSEAFQDSYSSEELYALVAGVRKYDVPRQYLFDLLDGIDLWIRNRSFETYDDAEVFAYRMGGAPLAAAVPILGFIKPGYEEPAIQAGKAVFLTNAVANVVQDVKLNKCFLARQDLEETEVDLARLKVRKTSPGLKHLVRLYGSRIEKLMYEGGKLASHLDFDARRSFVSLMALNWRMLTKMRKDPESVLDQDGVLSRREKFGLKTRHLMGMEGHIPVIPEDDGHHH